MNGEERTLLTYILGAATGTFGLMLLLDSRPFAAVVLIALSSFLGAALVSRS